MDTYGMPCDDVRSASSCRNCVVPNEHLRHAPSQTWPDKGPTSTCTPPGEHGRAKIALPRPAKASSRLSLASSSPFIWLPAFGSSTAPGPFRVHQNARGARISPAQSHRYFMIARFNRSLATPASGLLPSPCCDTQPIVSPATATGDLRHARDGRSRHQSSEESEAWRRGGNGGGATGQAGRDAG
jgi:hypothetical protein